MNWLLSIVRIAGTISPYTAWLVQLDAEIKSAEFQKRLRRLEDPISALHPDVRDLSRHIYDLLATADLGSLHLTDHQYEKYGRPLAMLEAQGYIRGGHAIGNKFVAGFRPSPEYVLYMCALYADRKKMDQLVTKVDKCQPGTWLHGRDIAKELDLPIRVVRSIFEIYEMRGLGTLSQELGTANYLCQA